MNAIIKYAVNFLSTIAVEVPKTEEEASPPKEEPNPELLLSCAKITMHKNRDKKKNRLKAIK